MVPFCVWGFTGGALRLAGRIYVAYSACIDYVLTQCGVDHVGFSSFRAQADSTHLSRGLALVAIRLTFKQFLDVVFGGRDCSLPISQSKPASGVVESSSLGAGVPRLFNGIGHGLFFGGLSVTAVLYNLVFIPWFSLVIVPALFLGLLLMVVWPSVAAAYWPWVDWTFLPLDWALQFADVGWWVVPSKVQGVVAASVAILLLYRFMSLKACSLLLGMIGLWWWFPSLTPLWRMDVLDVGHGLAIVIEQDERAIVYDTGSSWPGGSYVQSVIEPMLQQRGYAKWME